MPSRNLQLGEVDIYLVVYDAMKFCTYTLNKVE